MRKIYFLIQVFLFFSLSCIDHKCNLIVYSQNRPLQLWALLESLEKYVTGINNVTIIYRILPEFETSYKITEKYFCNFKFVREFSDKELYELSLKYLVKNKANYILIAFDDTVVKDYFDIQEAIAALEKYKGQAFFFHLGENIKQDNEREGPIKLPEDYEILNKFLMWSFKKGTGRWGLPINLDMTLYRKKDIAQKIFQQKNMSAPPIDILSSSSKCRGICYVNSKTMNLNINTNKAEKSFSKEWNRRYLEDYSLMSLLEVFNDGFKINISNFFKLYNESIVVEFPFNFVKREQS